MQVDVRILSPLIAAGGGTVELADGARGSDLLRMMGADRADCIWMIVNGRRQEVTFEIRDGDRIILLTPVAGG